MAEDSSIQERNKALAQSSFDNWRSGTGSPPILLISNFPQLGAHHAQEPYQAERKGSFDA